MAHLYLNSSDSQFGPAYSGPFRSFDFTLLFEDTILTILPASVFLVAAGARAVWLTSKPNKVATSFSRLTKLVSPPSPSALLGSHVDALRAPGSSVRVRSNTIDSPSGKGYKSGGRN